jgi:hypothetical protein
MPAIFPATFEVRIFGNLPGGVELVAAIELVSPANKDRPDQRLTFAVKCASYLGQGINLLVADIITSRRENLHNAVMGLLEANEQYHMSPDASLYAVAYRPMLRGEQSVIDLWPIALTLAENLPTLPLALRSSLVVPIDLESTYMEACRRSRLL